MSESSPSESAPQSVETGLSAGAAVIPPRKNWTPTLWLIAVIACVGFAYDTYTLLVMPLIYRPALGELLGVDRYTEAGAQSILDWSSYITWSSAICGGVFGLLGGWLTDRFGRQKVLLWSILLSAGSAVAGGFATYAWMLLIFRCTTFIGVCVEFVAAVAWLAELFPNPKQRESVLGYTQAFASTGGLLATGFYLLINQFAAHMPPIFGEQETWRYALIAGVIPALPLIFIRPFLPESPAWLEKRAAGTLKRPSVLELFRAGFLRVSIVSALLFACAFAAAFGALQVTPQMVPGLFKDTLGRQAVQTRAFYEAAKAAGAENGLALADLRKDSLALAAKAEKNSSDKALKDDADRTAKVLADAVALAREPKETFPTKFDEFKKRAEEARAKGAADADALERAAKGVQANQSLGKAIGFLGLAMKRKKDAPDDATAQTAAKDAQDDYNRILASPKGGQALDELKDKAADASKAMEDQIAGVQMYQEVGGLVGRFVLAFLATIIVSRRILLWLFQIPGLVLIPLVYFFPAAGLMPSNNVEWLKAGIFIAGFLTIAQFSFWGNYLPRVYPTHLRGTGESFAANIGGRMLGTSGQFMTALLAPAILARWNDLGQFGSKAYAAAVVVLFVYALGSILTFFLPQPKEEVAKE